MAHHDDHNEEHHHVTPISVFVKVFIALIGLTILTVVTSIFDFGMFNMVIAMGIASIKAALVIMFFMQLKYDNFLNKLYFLSSFLFLALFILITGSDLWTRDNGRAMHIDQPVSQGDNPALVNQLRISTPEQIAKGKVLYSVNCASCHGATGGGDGPAAAALNPKPRNFLSGEWKYGGAPTRVFHTLTKGVSGSAMASFSGLSTEHRMALTHYIRSLSPTKVEDSPEDLKVAGLTGDLKAFKPKTVVDVSIVMDNIAQADQVEIPDQEVKFPNHPAAALFAAQCAKCHGVNGEGAKVLAVGVNPSTSVFTTSWKGLQASWLQDSASFKKTVVDGLPGRSKPGISGFSSEEWSQLHSYARLLSGR